MTTVEIVVVVLGILAIILGPAGAVHQALKGMDTRLNVVVNGMTEKLDTMMTAWDKDREETREWLKSVQRTTTDNAAHIKVLLDRDDRE